VASEDTLATMVHDAKLTTKETKLGAAISWLVGDQPLPNRATETLARQSRNGRRTPRPRLPIFA